MTTRFEVYGPFEVPRIRGDRRAIDSDRQRLRDWWERLNEDCGIPLSQALGCYLFSIQAGKGALPWYVGKTESAFEDECFKPHKLVAFHKAMGMVARGTPHLTLLPNITPQGRLVRQSRNEQRQIIFLEEYLIDECVVRNPQLLNSRHTRLSRTLSVPGLINPSRGGTSAAAQKLVKLVRG